MNTTLARWIGDADALRHLEYFQVRNSVIELDYIRSRVGDFYISLVGELFERMRFDAPKGNEWARIGNAFVQLATGEEVDNLASAGILRTDAILFGSVAFYCGGFPASSLLVIRLLENETKIPESYKACFDFLARPKVMESVIGRRIANAITLGNTPALLRINNEIEEQSKQALKIGPGEWIPTRLLEHLIKRFSKSNIRAVLPEYATDFWNPLIKSFVNLKPPLWEFFPSQIEAIERGLLQRTDTFSLQMPTGAGKTALCETLLYWESKRTGSDASILLVPYRSLASELRKTVVKRLNAMGISSRCAYGGTVPTGEEVGSLSETRVVIATPESLLGLFGADNSFLQRVSLVICDEGHLLDGGARGISLELLLARMRSRESGAPRFVFVSAIVPNIEEINAWLGGAADSVVRSDYRPAIAEYSVLRKIVSGTEKIIDLEMHPHEERPTRFSINGFLSRSDFQWSNSVSGRTRTYPHASVKTLAIASARKSLPMGTTAVFAANKGGDQGAVGLAEELINQLTYNLSLPDPIRYVGAEKVGLVLKYLEFEYGDEWVGTRLLKAGGIIHHGDIPQETREVFETLLRKEAVRLAICTNTLAEGVNLPIRTLILYSVQRRKKDGRPVDMLSRDIKNLVGRAGRAGSTTKGLVICANEKQWPLIEKVARQSPGEPVRGYLLQLILALKSHLALKQITLTNSILENSPILHTLVDGIDATLIDLAVEEVGEDTLVSQAIVLADQTFASLQSEFESKQLLQSVFKLRAQRVISIRNTGRLGWLRETGARARILDVVENELLTRRDDWDSLAITSVTNFIDNILDWAWDQKEIQIAIRDALKLADDVDLFPSRQTFDSIVKSWLAGSKFLDISRITSLSIDEVMGIHGRVISFTFQTLVEQGIALLSKFLESQQKTLSPVVNNFPELLRFGVPTVYAQILAAGGVRHRSAAIEIGNSILSAGIVTDNRSTIFLEAQRSLLAFRSAWSDRLSSLVVENTLQDLDAVLGNIQDE